MSSLACYTINTLHFIYILATYFIIPYVFGSSLKWQMANMINIIILVTHWKVIGDRCILDILAKNHCDTKAYNGFNTTHYGINDMTFSNLVQLFLVSSFIISLACILKTPIPFKVRFAMLVCNFVTPLYLISLSKLYGVR